MDKFLEMIESLWANSFVRALVFLVVGLAAAVLASFIVKKICKLFKLDSRLGKLGAEGGRESSALKFIGRLCFLIVFLLFLPSVLDALGLDSVSDPITDFVSTFIRYLPNVIAALILVFLGVFIGEILSTVVTTLLAKTKIDSLSAKLSKSKTQGEENGTSDDNSENGESKSNTVSAIIGKIIYALVVLIAVVEALTVLDISVISEPALEIIATVFGVIPEIALAVIVFWIGLFLSGIVSDLVKNLLSGMKLDSVVGKAVPVLKNKFSATNIISVAVRVIIILFVAAEAIKILGFAVLSDISAEIVSYIPLLLKALVIAIVAFIGAGLADKALSKMKPVGTVIRILIYTVAAFMILSQLEFATVIVNYAFIISLCALALAFAIAFGIGGRDFAKKTLGKLDNQMSDSEGSDKSENNSSENK